MAADRGNGGASSDEPGQTGGGPGFELTFVQGRAVLGVGARPLAAAGRVDRLEMEIPGVRFPFDFSGGMARFQSRRCRLRELAVSTGAAEATGYLRGLRLERFGIHEARARSPVGVEGQWLHLDARVALGGREAGLTARLVVAPAGERRARLSLLDVRVFGFLPVPAPLLAAAVLRATGAADRKPPRRQGLGLPDPDPDYPVLGALAVSGSEPLVVLDGPTDLTVEVVELALLGTLVEAGWRLPERRRLRGVSFAGDEGARIGVRYLLAGEAAATAPEEEREGAGALGEHRAGCRRFASAERALLDGDPVLAAALYRAADPVRAGDRFAAGRLLALLASDAAAFDEGEALAAAALARWPGFVPALLARAAIDGEAGRHQEAAVTFERLAEGARGDRAEELAPADRAWALVAAARARERAGDGRAAAGALERALAIVPAHAGAARAQAARLAAEGRWSDLLRLVIERAVDSDDPRARGALHAEAGTIYLDRLADRARARDRFEQAVRADPDQGAAWEGLAMLHAADGDGRGARERLERALEAHRRGGDGEGQARVGVRLAEADLAEGRTGSAIARFLEAAQVAGATGADRATARARAAELGARAGSNGTGVASSPSPSPSPSPSTSTSTSTSTSMLASPLGAAREPVIEALEEAVERDPLDNAAYDALEALAVERGDWEGLADILARRLEVARTVDQPGLLRRQAALLADTLGQHDDAATAHRRLLDLEPEDVPALLFVARHLWSRGDVARSAGHYQRLLEQVEAPGGAGSGEGAAALAAEARHRLTEAAAASGAAAEGLVLWHGRHEDVRARNQAWADLLARGVPLAPATHGRVLQALAEQAAEDGDLPGALERYEEALGLETPPQQRADLLVGHARVLLMQRLVPDAVVDLAEALSLVPDHAGALALRAEIAFRAGDWSEARRTYHQLARAPGSDKVLPRAQLSLRRAVLAEKLGEVGEALVAYREAAALDPHQLEAREALARLALAGGDWDDLAEAARRLEEVLRLLPLGALDRIRDVRQRLGEVYYQLGDLDAARHYLELVLAEEPARLATLEALAAVYEAGGRHDQAAALCARLARAHTDPVMRAEALYRQGEIFRVALGDIAGAREAYLRASDLQPGFAPALVRLAAQDWSDGNLADLTEVGGELLDGRTAEELGPDGRAVALAVGLASVSTGGDAELARSALERSQADAASIAAAVAELAARLVPRTWVGALDASLAALAPLVDPARLIEALAGAAGDPGRCVGGALAIGRLAERRGDGWLSSLAYGMASLLRPGLPVGELAAVPAPAPGMARPAALAWGAADHPLASPPLRRVLHALARPLAGWPLLAATPVHPRAGAGLTAPVMGQVEELRARLAAPPVQTVVTTAGAEVRVTGTRLLTLAVGPEVLDLPPDEQAFLFARALEVARSGAFVLEALDDDALLEFLATVAAVLAPALDPAGEGPATAELRRWLAEPAAEALLPHGAARDRLREDLRAVLDGPPDLAAHRRGSAFTADRLGLLACGSPLAALRALNRLEGGRLSEAIAALVAHALSTAYRAAVAAG
jgi:tetratricopeptide (TPR) repeat protein